MFRSLVLILVSLSLTGAFANEASTTTNVNNETINIDGEFHEKVQPETIVETKTAEPEFVDDEELVKLKGELKEIKNMNTGFEKKTETFQEMTETATKLTANQNEYLKGRSEYEKTISAFRMKQECLKTKDAKDCVNLDTRSEEEKKAFNISIRNEFSSVIQNKRFELQACYQSVLKSQKPFEDAITVLVKIGKEGTATHVGFENMKGLYDTKIQNCITKVLYDIQLNNRPYESVTFRQVLNFNIKNKVVKSAKQIEQEDYEALFYEL